MAAQPKKRTDVEKLRDRCLSAFVRAGTIELSLDQIAARVGVSKRMLIHYFHSRENLEEAVIVRLEDKLRAQFAPEAFPVGAPLESVLMALWQATVAPQNRGILLLVMDVSRRAWNNSRRAKAFYAEQQRLWVELLMKFLPNREAVEDVLQLFQGAVLAYLITGYPEPGWRSLRRALAKHR